MVNFAGYSLVMISSFNPLHSTILKKPRRFLFDLCYHKISTKSRLCLSAYTQEHQFSFKTTQMGAERYLPPLFSVAPMMEWTDVHYRTLARIISKHAWLYTEMLAAETIVYQEENLDRFLAFPPEQHPIVLQIGGNNIGNIAKATQLSNRYGYDEINFNCGCPSPKVAGHGCFGVSLMLDPKFVAEAMSVIAANTDAPVSVKCRIGVDDHDSYNELCDFIYTVSSLSPTKHFVIHSRKALLNGISPADNRRIPPLKYEYYFALLRDFPDLTFTINGGINSVDEVNAALREGAHGVMVGRAAYKNPWRTLGLVDSAIYGAPISGLTRRQVLEQYEAYGDAILGTYGNGRPNVREVVKPLLHFFYSEPGNGPWKRKADAAFMHCKTIKSFFEETLVAIPDSVMDSPIAEAPSGRQDLFAGVRGLLPPPYEKNEYEKSEQEVQPQENTKRGLENQTSMMSYTAEMASITMAASTALTSRGSVSGSRGRVVAIAARGGEEGKNGRRDLVFAAAVAAVCSSVAGIAVAVEPKRGSAEARKVYAPVCITNPTAKICHR